MEEAIIPQLPGWPDAICVMYVPLCTALTAAVNVLAVICATVFNDNLTLLGDL